MKTRTALIGGAALFILAAAASLTWYALQGDLIDGSDSSEAEAPLPIPPVPPRIAEGGDYEKCLGMLTNDPEGAQTFANAWEATGGGDGATHCLGLATIALGEPAKGADILEKLANASSGSAVSRATLYGQADQAWLMADDIEHAFGAATLALSLSPDDPDLLIDRAIAGGLLERFQDSVDDLTHALEIDPRRADAYTFRSAAWRHLGHPELAKDDIDRALLIEPDRPEALLERGILRQRQNDQAGARRDWERAVELAPNTPTADLAQQNLDLLEAGPQRP